MLVDVKFIFDPAMEELLSILGQGGQPEKIETGIYLSKSFSMGNRISNNIEEYGNYVVPSDSEDYEEEWLGSYGVSDDVEQIKKRYKKFIDDPEKKYCIGFTPVKKSEQPHKDGWIWHKWGEYIGDKKPQHEYLYDEDDSIEEILCYHIYEILD